MLVSKQISIASKSFWTLLVQVSMRGSFTITTLILARNFGVEEFADFAYFLVTLSAFSAVGALGIQMSATKVFATRSGVRIQDGQIGALSAFSFLLASCVSLVILAVPSSILGMHSPALAKFLAPAVFCFALTSLPLNALIAIGSHHLAAIVTIATGLIIVAGALLASSYASLNVAVSAIFIASVIQLLLAYFVFLRKFGLRRFTRLMNFSGLHVAHFMKFAGSFLVVTIISSMLPWVVSRIVLIAHGTSIQFATFSIGMQWFALSMLAANAISRATAPDFAAADRSNERKALIRRVAIVTGASSLLLISIGTFISPELAALYGPSFSSAHEELALFLWPGVAASIAAVLGNALAFASKELVWMKLYISFAAITSALTILGVQAPTIGVPVGYMIGYLALGIGAYIQCKRNAIL